MVKKIVSSTTILLALILSCAALTTQVLADEDEELQLVPQLGKSQTTGGQLPQTGPGAGETLFDIYGPVPTKSPLPYIPLAIGLALLLALLCAVAYFFYRRKNRPPAAIPPWDRALTELAEAKSLRHPDSGLAYMNRASQILRNYIESRFGIRSTRQTTREFLHSEALEDNSELHGYRPELRGCLEQADMAKFAHHIDSENDLVLMEDAVTTFVITTRPEPVPGGSS